MANLSPLRHPDHLLALLVRGLRNGRTHPFRYPAGRAASTPSQGGPFSACRGVRFQSAVNSAHCASKFYRYPYDKSHRFCSHRCASDAKRRYAIELHRCRQCGNAFDYSAKPFSNSTGEYCSLACKRCAFLGVINGDASRKAATTRPGWRSRRNRFFREGNACCAICGTTSGRLHVHHIEGHLNVAPDDLTTVTTVCVKHHSRLEILTRAISGLKPEQRRLVALVVLGALGDTRAIHTGRMVLRGECA